jgi:hypothetical protein
VKAKIEAPALKPSAQPAPAAVVVEAVGATLHRDDPIVDAPSIGTKTAARLEAVGLRTVGDLLSAEPESAAKSVKASHITPPVIRTWQAQAMLACAIPSLRSFDAQVLVGVGVPDVMTLSTQTSGRLANAIADYLKTTEGKQLGRGSKPADQATVARWIEAAQTALSASRSAA